MDGTSLESLPSVKIPSSLKVRRESQSPTKLDIHPEMAVTFSPVVVSSHSSDKFPTATFKKDAARRYSLNTSRTAAYGTPEVVKKIFTGQLPPTYFNDFCNGYRRDSPREFQYRGPTKEREVPLWEPKSLRRTEARHKIRDIQDARFRKQDALEENSRRKSVSLSRKTAACLLTCAETMPSGKQAFLDKLDKEKDKYVQRCMSNKKTREAMIKLEDTQRRYSVFDKSSLPPRNFRDEDETDRRQSVY